MSGYNTILRLRKLEAEVERLGFMFSHPRHGSYDDHGEQVALRPRDEQALPIYSRDAELFVGTLEQLEVWLRGVAWAREYDRMLRVSDDQKRARKEQDARNEQIVRLLKTEEKAQKSQ